MSVTRSQTPPPYDSPLYDCRRGSFERHTPGQDSCERCSVDHPLGSVTVNTPREGLCFPRRSVASAMCTPQTSRFELELRANLDREINVVNAACRKYTAPPITQLNEHLFIGGFPTNETLDLLRDQNITHIINCCSGEKRSTDSESLFHVAHINARDDPDYYILHHHFDSFLSLVDEVTRGHGKVFVHCYAGVNRSAALCVAYLMERCGMDPIESVRLFRKQGRMVVLDNQQFRQQLVQHFFYMRPDLLRTCEC